MRIGKLAAELGVSTKTLRHYEKIGLLPEAERMENGYRNFSPQAVKTARMIVALRRLEFSLDAIGRLLAEDQERLRSNLMGILDERRNTATISLSVLQGQLEEMDARYIELATTPRSRPGSCICAFLGLDCAC
jgi:DNA-binding transcriptional MerR regulator